jgi:hypothetical protein
LLFFLADVAFAGWRDQLQRGIAEDLHRALIVPGASTKARFESLVVAKVGAH